MKEITGTTDETSEPSETPQLHEEQDVQQESAGASQDRPILSLLRQIAVISAVAILALAAAGFFMGLIGAKTPFVSSQVLWSKLDQITGQQDSTAWNELEKNP